MITSLKSIRTDKKNVYKMLSRGKNLYVVEEIRMEVIHEGVEIDWRGAAYG